PLEGPVASFVPVIVMAVLFGLAMDYEVFLVSAMREHHARHGDAYEAIRAGSRQAGRVVVAAAAIMITVFVSFLFSHDPNVMPIAFALAFGVLVDAFLVRLTLVPAVLKLLGDRAWRLPRWLDRIVPKVDVEGHDVAGDKPAVRTPELVG
ncbi:MAG: MMPL family transporter, partial [Actinoplanes sp.]